MVQANPALQDLGRVSSPGNISWEREAGNRDVLKATPQLDSDVNMFCSVVTAQGLP